MTCACAIPAQSGQRSLESQGVLPGRKGTAAVTGDSQRMDAAAQPQDGGSLGFLSP